MSMLHDGLVVASFGRHCLVESGDGARRICHPRGKKSEVVVGDRVQWSSSGDEGAVESITERRNLFYRQDDLRTKSFAANLDQVLVLVAAEPVFSQALLARALIAAHAQGITPLIALNKQDLSEPFARAWERLAPYRAMGYTVLPLALRSSDAQASGLALLAQALDGHTTLVLGPSGAGKSTLINRLVPQAQAQTGEISQALNSGRHTTTRTTWYWLDEARRGALIDSPGFQAFGLQHIAATDLARWMPDLAEHAGECRFANCTHRHEPGCGVLQALQGGAIDASRHDIYSQLFDELTTSRY
ncbi:MAG: ribosome small subunit-dependent GTPase A [Burkholderiaceae bacterium]|jgi:ribosome biogenesis GTPase